MSMHTPGPWHATDFLVEAVHPEYNDGNGMTVLACVTGYFGDRDTQKANARLIAAAPEMLRTLRFAAMALAKASESNVAYDDACQEVARTIALATGLDL